MLEKDRALLRNIVIVMLVASVGLVALGIWTHSLTSAARGTPPTSDEPVARGSGTITSMDQPLLPRAIETQTAEPQAPAPTPEPSTPPPPPLPPPAATDISPGMLNALDSGQPFVAAPYVPPPPNWTPPAGWTFVPPQEIYPDGGLAPR